MSKGSSQNGWPEINPLDEHEVPEFPTESLPDPLRRWVEAESVATQTPPDLAGLLTIAVCAASIAGRVKVQASEAWSEPTNVFVTVALDPANRKSAVFSEATRPLREIEDELIAAAKPEIERLESERRQEEGRLRSLEKKGEFNEEARQEALDLAAELTEKPIPQMPRLLVDDATPEKIGMLLAEQEGRIASFSPEGNVFDLMVGGYSKNSTPQFDIYLKGHSGDDLRTDRVGRESIRVLAPALTCGYTVQPSVLRSLAANKALRGRGLLARFLFAIPKSRIGHRHINPAPVPKDVQADYAQLIRRLNSDSPKLTLMLTTEAEFRFLEWQRIIESDLAEGGALEAIRDWGGKLAGATLRIAAIFNVVEYGVKREIQAATMDSAIQIAQYLIEHAKAAFALLETLDEADSDARYLLRWIRQTAERKFSKRDAHQQRKNRFKKITDLEPVLVDLVERGYIRQDATLPEKKKGRNPSPLYEVNPAVFGVSDSKTLDSHNSQKQKASPPARQSEDSEDVIAVQQGVECREVEV